MENILITGANGFIAKEFIRTLIALGYPNIIVITTNLDLLKSKFSKLELEKIRIFEGSFTDEKLIKSIADSVPGLIYLFHLGGSILQGYRHLNGFDVNESIKVNILGSLSLVLGLKEKLSGIFLASSADVYEAKEASVITELSRTKPSTFYAASKLSMEDYVRIEVNDELPLCIARFTHVYGPDDPHPKVLKQIIDSVKKDELPIIYGDGEDLRDYIHISDVIKILIKAFQIKPNGLINVATGSSHRISDIAGMVLMHYGKDETQFHSLPRTGVKKNYVFDISNLEMKLNYRPEISLRKGIQDICNETT